MLQAVGAAAVLFAHLLATQRAIVKIFERFKEVPITQPQISILKNVKRLVPKLHCTLNAWLLLKAINYEVIRSLNQKRVQRHCCCIVRRNDFLLPLVYRIQGVPGGKRGHRRCS
jgi:hypothetical protein